jgi:hypothetical protein
MNGLQVTVIGPNGKTFECRYARTELPMMLDAVQKLIFRQQGSFCLQIEPSEPPPPPMSLADWIAAGHTTD